MSLAQRAPLEATSNELWERLQAAIPEYRQDEFVMVINESKESAHELAYLLWPEYRLLWQCFFEETSVREYGMQIVSAEKFREHINECGASYIAIVALDDEFVQAYGDFFDAPPEEGQVFRVTEGTEALELIWN